MLQNCVVTRTQGSKSPAKMHGREAIRVDRIFHSSILEKALKAPTFLSTLIKFSFYSSSRLRNEYREVAIALFCPDKKVRVMEDDGR